MKRKMSLEDELDVTRTSVAELTGWCITIALHDLFGIGRERLNRVNNRQRMLAEQSMAIMMQPNERGMPSTEKARRMRAEALPESVPREFRVPALRAARNRREQQLKIVGDRAATMAWQLHARACMEVLGFGPDDTSERDAGIAAQAKGRCTPESRAAAGYLPPDGLTVGRARPAGLQQKGPETGQAGTDLWAVECHGKAGRTVIALSAKAWRLCQLSQRASQEQKKPPTEKLPGALATTF